MYISFEYAKHQVIIVITMESLQQPCKGIVILIVVIVVIIIIIIPIYQQGSSQVST